MTQKTVLGDFYALGHEPTDFEIKLISHFLTENIHLTAETNGYKVDETTGKVVVKQGDDHWTVGYKVEATKKPQGLKISDLQQQVNQLLDEKGFLNEMESIRNVSGENQLLFYLGALLATEPAEMIDAVKKQKGTDAVLEEAADTIIRAMNIFIVLDADAEYIIGKKMDRNFGRPYLYGHGEGK